MFVRVGVRAVIALSLLVVLLVMTPAAGATQFSVVPNVDVSKDVGVTTGCGATTGIFASIDEKHQAVVNNPCGEYVRFNTGGGTPGNKQATFNLTASPAGPYNNVNRIFVGVNGCVESALGSPTVKIEVLNGASVIVSEFRAGFGACGAAVWRTIYVKGTQLNLTKTQVDNLQVRLTALDGTTDHPVVRVAAVDLTSNACTANLCGNVIDSYDILRKIWSACDGTAANAVKISKNGAAAVAVPCDATGEFEYTGSVTAGDEFVIYTARATLPADKGVLVYRAPRSGVSVDLYTGMTTLQSEYATAPTITNADIGLWDNSNDATWIPGGVTAGALSYPSTWPILVYAGASSAAAAYAPGGAVTTGSIILEDDVDPGTNVITLTSSGTLSACESGVGAAMPYCRWGNAIIQATTGSTVRYTGTADIKLGVMPYYNLELRPASGTPVFTGITDTTAMTVNNDLLVGDGTGTPSVDVSLFGDITVKRDLTIGAGSSVSGADADIIAITRNVSGAGTYNTTGTGLLQVSGAGASTFGPTTATGTWTINNLEMSTPGAASTVTLAAAGTGAISVLGDFTLGPAANTSTTTLNLTTNGRPIDVGGTMNIDAKGSFTGSATTTNTLTVRNDFAKNGTFTANGGKVVLTPTTDGLAQVVTNSATTFANLQITGPGEVDFDETDQTNVTVNLTTSATGCASAQRLDLRSVVFGNQWDLNVTGTKTVSNTVIQDGNAVAPITGGAETLDAGNNTGWTFNSSGACQLTAPNTYTIDAVASPATGITSTSPVLRYTNRATIAVNDQELRVRTSDETGLKALYHFDNVGTDVVGGPAANLANGALYSASGRTEFAQSLHLDGVNDVATIADSPGIGLSAGSTVEYWLKPTSLPTSGTALIMAKTTDAAGCTVAGSCTYGFEYRAATDALCYVVDAGGTLASACGSSSAELTDGFWHHVAGVFDAGNNLRLYVDGLQVATVLGAGAPVANTAVLRIGATAGGTSPFAGDVDELRFATSYLTASEIAGYYHTSLPHLYTLWSSGTTVVSPACAANVQCAAITYGSSGSPLSVVRNGARYAVESRVRDRTDGVWSLWGRGFFTETVGITVTAPASASLGTALPATDMTTSFATTVVSNDVTGYELTGQWSTAMTHQVDGVTIIPNLPPVGTAPTRTWSAGASLGVGVTVLSTTANGVAYNRLPMWGASGAGTETNYAGNNYAGLSTSKAILLHRRIGAAASPSDTVTLSIRANTPATQKAGAYQGTLVLTAIANP